MRGFLVIMSGPSGVGKGTVRKYLFEKKNMNLVYSTSMTTRQQRTGEIDGVDYYFVSDEDFDKAIESGDLLEFATFVGNRYGSPKSKIEELRDKGVNVLLEIDVQGTQQVLEKYVCDDRVFSIFLIPPHISDLEYRIRNRRTEEEYVIQERLQKGKKEIEFKDRYDYVVVNDDPQLAADRIIKIIEEKYK